MTTGLTIEEIKTEIRSIATRRDDLHSVFGFGSCFRGENYRDVDILIVLKTCDTSILPIYYALKIDIEALGRTLGVIFDLTVLTVDEFAERPLRDMDSLVEIFQAASWRAAVRDF